jgi:hypothetical protein
MKKLSADFISGKQRDAAARAATAALAPVIGGRRMLIHVLPSGQVTLTPAKQVTRTLLKIPSTTTKSGAAKKSIKHPSRKVAKGVARTSAHGLSKKAFADSVKLIAGTD